VNRKLNTEQFQTTERTAAYSALISKTSNLGEAESRSHAALFTVVIGDECVELPTPHGRALSSFTDRISASARQRIDTPGCGDRNNLHRRTLSVVAGESPELRFHLVGDAVHQLDWAGYTVGSSAG
jgi:hypothetical protein